MRSKAGLLMAALAMTAAMPVLEVRRRSEDEPLRPMKPDPDDRGRRAEKNAIALAKAKAKRQRKAAKRLGQKVVADDTALKGANVLDHRLDASPACGQSGGSDGSAALDRR